MTITWLNYDTWPEFGFTAIKLFNGYEILDIFGSKLPLLFDTWIKLRLFNRPLNLYGGSIGLLHIWYGND